MTSSENRASSAETAQPKERGRRAQVSSEDRVRKELAFRACVIRITLAVGSAYVTKSVGRHAKPENAPDHRLGDGTETEE
jgi:hypothetical protein